MSGLIHSPLASSRDHDYVYDGEYRLDLCQSCGRAKSLPGGMAESVRHDQSPRGCRVCRRQFTHKMPHDLDRALEQAAYEVGYYHGLMGRPEWTQASKEWFGRHFYLYAYDAGYGQGERARETAA